MCIRDRVKAVSDGAQVVDAVRALRPDVLVTDIIMPRRDGFRILEELGELPEQERPRVIVLTGLSRDDLILRAVKLGASYYMVKPFDARLLACRIREVAASFEDAVIPASTSSRDVSYTHLTTSAVWMPMPSPKPWKMGITESIFMPCRSV